MSKPPQMPARGALAGVRADLAAAKQAGDGYDPRAAGSAWSHNFLNQKPWHPLNFRNQIRKFEAEEKNIKAAKDKETALAEFQAEQEKLQTMSYLSAEEQERYAQRQSISFMYAKPPGLEAALERERENEAKAKRLELEAAKAAQAEATVPAAAAAAGPTSALTGLSAGASAAAALPQQERSQQLDRLREDPFAAMLAARVALQQNERFVLVAGGGGAAGGYGKESANQQLLADEEEEGPSGRLEAEPGDEADALLASLSSKERKAVLKALDKKRKRQEEEAKLEQARAVLRAAGYDPDALARAEAGSSGRGEGGDREKHKKGKKEKKQKRERHDREERDERVDRGQRGLQGKEGRGDGEERGEGYSHKHQKRERREEGRAGVRSNGNVCARGDDEPNGERRRQEQQEREQRQRRHGDGSGSQQVDGRDSGRHGRSMAVRRDRSRSPHLDRQRREDGGGERRRGGSARRSISPQRRR